MNPYTFAVDCDVCGGPGVSTGRTMAAYYLNQGIVSHNDPRVCRDYLAEQRRKMEIQ